MIGRSLGPYQVVAKLGEGGMGEVYRASDTRLKRQVAIKILPESFAMDPDRLARFQREAEMLAALNHPHIAAIYGLEDAQGVKALVMELVEGEDLAARLGRGPLAPADARPIARQIAHALEAAHERGIIHRDLKPGNIKVRPDGTVKVLDFGLAKIVDAPAGRDVSRTPTITSPMATLQGAVLGTPAYMSPEQAKGLTATPRSDIWAFGCVLFEMLSGRPPFAGDTVTEMMAGVLKSEPDWPSLPADTPPPLRRLLRRCLEKDERLRLRDIGDARLEIDEVGSDEAPVGHRREAGLLHRRERLVWLAAVGALAAALLVMVSRGTVTAPPASPWQLDMVTPAVSDPFDLVAFAISPDGRALAFVADAAEQAQIHVRSLDSGVARPVSGTARAGLMAWSPDGRSLAFNADGDLKRVDLDGGRPRTLAQATFMIGASWSQDGVILFAPNPASGLWRVPADGGTPSMVTAVEPGQAGHGFPQFLPDGRHFIYVAFGRPDVSGVYLGRLDDPLKRRLIDTSSMAVHAAGHLFFVQKDTIFAQGFDATTLALQDRPAPVAAGILENLGYFVTLSATDSGTVAFRTGSASRAKQFVWFDRAGRVLEKVGEPDPANAAAPSPSPDGTHVAMFRRGQDAPDSDIWQLETRRGVLTRFTTTPGEDIFPSWSRDGARIAFTSNRNRLYELYAKSTQGAGEETLLVSGSAEETFVSDWSPDGRLLLYQRRSPKTGWDLWALTLSTGASAPFLQTESDERDAIFSPDGRWIVYGSNSAGRYDVYVRPSAGGVATPVSTNGGVQPRWRADGRELFYVALDGRLMAVDIASPANGPIEVGSPTFLFPTKIGRVFTPGGSSEYIPSPDGTRILMNTVVSDPGPAPIRLVLNWSPGR
jgi:Tol biopolymer transport system component